MDADLTRALDKAEEAHFWEGVQEDYARVQADPEGWTEHLLVGSLADLGQAGGHLFGGGLNESRWRRRQPRDLHEGDAQRGVLLHIEQQRAYVPRGVPPAEDRLAARVLGPP